MFSVIKIDFVSERHPERFEKPYNTRFSIMRKLAASVSQVCVHMCNRMTNENLSFLYVEYDGLVRF